MKILTECTDTELAAFFRSEAKRVQAMAVQSFKGSRCALLDSALSQRPDLVNGAVAGFLTGKLATSTAAVLITAALCVEAGDRLGGIAVAAKLANALPALQEAAKHNAARLRASA